MATVFDNGVSFPESEPRPHVSTLCGGHIAAIDFGTTNCSLAYCLKNDLMDMQKKTKIIKLDGINIRAPTAVLIDHKGEIIRFGRDAENEWNDVCDSPNAEKDKYFFFRQIKMKLLREENITTMTTIKAANGKECFLIEVIAIILRYIKDRLITVDLRGNCYGIKDASDFNWVITVPAIWKPRAKQMMREAAYMAGIASKESVIKKLTVAKRAHGGFITAPVKPDRQNTFPHQLSLALEPEGAALYCMHSSSTEENEVLKNLKSCLVADIGGGTVDISSITQSGSDATKLEAVIAPAGNEYGGTKVNKAILEFLGKLFKDPDFEKYKTTGKDSDMIELEKKIEEKKCEFGDATRTNKGIVINLPSAFVATYASSKDSDSDDSVMSQPLIERGVTLDGRRLEISYARMEEFFKPAVDAIISCIETCLGEVETVFLVGGFGGCNYVYNKVKPVIEQHSCRVYKSPGDHTTAVVVGAVMYRKDPEIFSARVADATYGTCCQVRFNHERYGHSYDYHIYDDDGVAMCKGLFSPMVTAGEVLHRDRVIISRFSPAEHGMKSMNFEILATEDKRPCYAYTPSGSLMPGIQKIGNVKVSMPDPTGDKDRNVKLTFDFSDTEIQVQAHDLTSGEKASTVVDFLGD